MDIADIFTVSISLVALILSIYNLYEKERSKREDALVFLRDFNNEGWQPCLRVKDKPSCDRFYESVDQLRKIRNHFPRDLLPKIDEYLSKVELPMDMGWKVRSAHLKEIEKELRDAAKDRIK